MNLDVVALALLVGRRHRECVALVQLALVVYTPPQLMTQLDRYHTGLRVDFKPAVNIHTPV